MPVTVKVKGGGEVKAEALLTEVGPVITELSGDAVVAFRWHALELADHSAELFYGLNRAGSVEDALKAAALPSVVSQNLVVADAAGDFAWQVFGAVVKRRGYSGRLPYPASDPAYGWEGYFAALPGERRPERGYIQTANSRPDWPEADAISTDYVPPWRFGRIGERLLATPKATPAAMGEIQRDRRDLHAAARAPALLDGVALKAPGAELLL